MNIKVASRRLFSKFQRFLLAVLVVLTAFGSLPVTKAYAWSYTNVSGRPGSVSVPTVRFGDTLLQTSAGLIPTLRVDSNGSYFYAYRSPATSGDQSVAVMYTLQGWSGTAWVQIAQQGMYTGLIKAGQNKIPFAPLNIVPSNFLRGYYYRVIWAIIWNTPTGTTLGGTLVASNLATDYSCVTTLYVCDKYISPGAVLIK